MEGDTGKDVSRRVGMSAWDRVNSPDGTPAVLGTGTTEPRGGAGPCAAREQRSQAEQLRRREHLLAQWELEVCLSAS